MAETSFPKRHPIATTLLGLLALLVVAGGITYFATDRGRNLLPTLEKPTLNVQNVTREKLKAEMKVGLRNHTPLTLRIDSLRYETYLDNARLAQGRKDRPTVVKGNTTSQIELPLTLNLPQVINKVKTAQQDCVTVRMRTVLYTRLPSTPACRAWARKKFRSTCASAFTFPSCPKSKWPTWT